MNRRDMIKAGLDHVTQHVEHAPVFPFEVAPHRGGEGQQPCPGMADYEQLHVPPQ